MSGLLAACGTVPTAPVQGGAPASDVAFAVVADALSLAGTPYRDGGVSPETGFDCSGLIYYVYGRQGVRLPRVAAAMASALQAVPEGDRRAGDLLFFNTRGSDFSHVALYVGDERFVHAPSERTGRVIVSTLQRDYWRKRLSGVRRPAPQLTAAALAPS